MDFCEHPLRGLPAYPATRGKARGGDVSCSMATSSNAAMRKKTPFHFALFRKQTTRDFTTINRHEAVAV